MRISERIKTVKVGFTFELTNIIKKKADVGKYINANISYNTSREGDLVLK